MTTKAQAIEWRCIPESAYYIVICKSGVFELAETIERQKWARSIDRCLIFKRVVEDLRRNMANVLKVDA